MSKLDIRVIEWRPRQQNSLQGFASIELPALRLRIHELAIHRKGRARWVAFPARPMLDRTGAAIREDGRIKYSKPILQFVDHKYSDTFSRRVIDALLAFQPEALNNNYAQSGPPAHGPDCFLDRERRKGQQHGRRS
jgi:hypothetical protein